MIRDPDKFCAKCAKSNFSDHPAEAEAGRVRCTMFEKFEDWNERACVLFDKAKNMSKRVVWIQEQQLKQQERENAGAVDKEQQA